MAVVTVVEFALLGMTLRLSLPSAHRPIVVRGLVASPAACVPSPFTVTIAPAVADAWIANPNTFLGGARLIPTFRAGHFRGFKLAVVRPDSPLSAIGFRTGDLITHIDGLDLTDRDTERELIHRLHTPGPRSFLVDLIRNGCPMRVSVTAV